MESSQKYSKPHKRGNIKVVLFQVVILLALWLIFSGHYDVMHISLGVAATIIVVVINYRLLKVDLYPERDEPYLPIKLIRLPAYLLWLVKEIFMANLQVAYLVIHPKMPIDPFLVTFETKLPTSAAKVILGNSITITPGTITIDIEHDKFLVHCIIPGTAGSLENGQMQSRIMKLYQDEITGAVTEFKFIDDEARAVKNG
ncbi:MAG: Na+/H+ antiporter subunit E [Bacteroidetes bacterium]|nr:Na+/H+ antiporter subunit E [Bacteroidota bacterium]MBU2471286.1 Na+/H+ antiporter subunit E [Bacteroidota bacterium]